MAGMEASDRELIGATLELLMALAFKLTGEEPCLRIKYEGPDGGKEFNCQGSYRVKWSPPAAPSVLGFCPQCGRPHAKPSPAREADGIPESSPEPVPQAAT